MEPPLLNLVLYTPQIPNNTGNIGRTALAISARLHLIHPLGFSLSDKACRRAGLDYWSHLDVVEHADWASYLASEDPQRLWLFSTKAGRSFREPSWQRGDHLLFGPEDRGLPHELHDAVVELERILRLRVHRAFKVLVVELRIDIITSLNGRFNDVHVVH